MLRKFFACLLIVVCAGFFLRWLMGEDFGPFVDTAKESMKEQFVKLIDEYELQLMKSRDAVKAAEERAVKLRLQQHKARAGLVTVDREIKLARTGIVEAKTRLVGLRNKLDTGQTIRLVSGRVATNADLRDFVERYATNIELAEEKLGYLEQFRQRRQTRHAKLAELDKQSPAAIRRLRNSVDFLEKKIELYREIKEWLEQEEAADAELAGLYDRAQRTLEDAHSRIDAKLAEIDAMLTLSIDLDVVPESDESTSSSLVAQIQSILNDDGVVVQP